MKVRSSVKPICKDCRVILRCGVVRVICIHKKHKQRQPGAARKRAARRYSLAA